MAGWPFWHANADRQEAEGGFSDRQRRRIARIRKAADRGRALADSMLSIGSQQRIYSTPIDIASLMRGMADVLEMAIGPRTACSSTSSAKEPLSP